MKKLVVNVETQESEIIDLDELEIESLEKSNNEHNAQLEAKAEAAAAKAALLEKLGITKEEAKLLLP